MRARQGLGLALASVIVLGAAGRADAQGAPQDCADLRPAIRAAAALLKARYVVPKEASIGAEMLLARAAAPDEARICGGPDAQANHLTQILRSAIPDWHLRAAPGAPPAKQAAPQASSDVLDDADDHGVEEVSRLAGGIGYLRISEFDDVSAARPRLAHAMALLAGVKGVIIDVRGNRGGDGDTVDLVLRSFLAADAPPTFVKLDRMGAPVPHATVEPAWQRFHPDANVVVLVDRASASGAEALAFGLREEGRATIVGERSLGAAHVVENAYSLPGDFSLFVPEFRLVGRRSSNDWEQTGVAPDIEAEGQDALLLAWEQARRPRPASGVVAGSR